MKTLFLSSFLLSVLFSVSLSAQDDKAIQAAKDYFTRLDGGDIEGCGALLAEDFSATAPFSPVAFDKTGWKGVGMGFVAGFPDMQHKVVDCFSAGNKVAVKGIFKGTNTGSMMGNPATGNQVSSSFTTLFELNDKGLIKSINVQFDNKAFESQLMAGLPDPKAMAESTVRAYLAALDAGDAEKAFSYCSADCLHYFASTKPLDKAETTARIQGFKKGFPDIARTVKDIVVADGKVAIRVVVTGTNTGPFMGMAPTGNKITFEALGLMHLDATGKISTAYVELDPAILTNQLKSTGTSTGSVEPVKN